MNTDQKIAVLVQTISHQGGRIDALASALGTMLGMARATPGLAQLMEQRLERQYAELLARSENTDYVTGFDSVREALVKEVREARTAVPTDGPVSEA